MKALVLFCLLGSTAWATTYLPGPPTVAGKLEAAAVVGEFAVTSVTTVVLDDAFPVSHVTLTPRTSVKNAPGPVLLILAGGIVEGRFQRGVPDGFQVHPGDVVIAELADASGLPGHYNLATSPESSFFIRVQTPAGDRLMTPGGRIVAGLPCDGPVLYAEDVPPSGSDLDEEGNWVELAAAPDVVLAADAERAGLAWTAAVEGLRGCGGGS